MAVGMLRLLGYWTLLSNQFPTMFQEQYEPKFWTLKCIRHNIIPFTILLNNISLYLACGIQNSVWSGRLKSVHIFFVLSPLPMFQYSFAWFFRCFSFVIICKSFSHLYCSSSSLSSLFGWYYPFLILLVV